MKGITRNGCLLVLSVLLFSYKFPSLGKKKIPQPEWYTVVELFTSEGCSSCPPAEEVIGRIQDLKKNVYILCFHVDYWNYLGWKDVYSDPVYSTRQQEYGKYFNLKSIYTPQIIVNGESEFVGTDEARLRKLIFESSRQIPKTDLELNIGRFEKNSIAVTCKIDERHPLNLNLALVQFFAKTNVTAGENEGKTLEHYYTVRDFKTILKYRNNTEEHLTLPKGISSTDCEVMAYLQDEKTGRIVAATRAALP